MLSLAVLARARSSASVVEVVTVSCFEAFHVTQPPRNIMRWPWEDFLSMVLSAYDASEETSRPHGLERQAEFSSEDPNCKHIVIVFFRYCKMRWAALRCSSFGFWLCLAILDTAKLMSGLVIIAAYKRCYGLRPLGCGYRLRPADPRTRYSTDGYQGGASTDGC